MYRPTCNAYHILLYLISAYHDYPYIKARIPVDATPRYSPRAGGTEIQMTILLRSTRAICDNIKANCMQYDY